MGNIKGSIGFRLILSILLVGAGFVAIVYYFSNRLAGISEQVSEMNAQLESASRERDVLRQGLQAAVERSSPIEVDRPPVDDRLTESLRRALSEEERMIGENQEFLDRLNKALTDLAAAVQEEKNEREAAINQLLQERESGQARMTAMKAELENLGSQLKNLQGEVAKSLEAAGKYDDESLASILTGQEELKGQVRQITENLRDEMSVLEDEVDRLEARIDDLNRDLVRLESRRPQ